MYTVTKYPQGTFSWADCNTTDAAAAKPFYSEVMGWQSEETPLGDGQFYTMFKQDGHDVAGFGPQQDGMPSAWNTYVSVDDVDAMQDKVTELGGTIIVPPFDVLDSGRMMTVQDPTGAFINLWQPKSHIGAGLVNTTGAMCWNELVTSDMEKAKAFYSGLFGWNISDDDYAIITNNGRMNGGIRQPSEAESQLPPHWLIYFTVADVEAAAEKIKKMGGTLNGPLMDSGAGKTAYTTDPAGARIALIQVETADPWEE